MSALRITCALSTFRICAGKPATISTSTTATMERCAVTKQLERRPNQRFLEGGKDWELNFFFIVEQDVRVRSYRVSLVIFVLAPTHWVTIATTVKFIILDREY